MTTSLRVLIADEDAASRAAIATSLEGAGHAVEVAASNTAAMARLRRESFDVLIFDVWASYLPGITLYATAKEFNESIDGIVVTAVPTLESLKECRRAGIQEYFLKPIGYPGAIADAVERIAEKIQRWRVTERALATACGQR
jgi:DNA-binding NtrC family response regulator